MPGDQSGYGVMIEMNMQGFWVFFSFAIGFIECKVSSARQLSLHNKNLLMAALPVPPLLSMRMDQNGQPSYSGLLWDFVEYIQKARNCTFKVVFPPDRSFGNCHGVNNCTGMIGMVNRGEVDFAIGKMVVYQ